MKVKTGLRPNTPEPSAPGAAANHTPPQFMFGAARYASTGPRRLFVPRKGLMSPVFDAQSVPRRKILRVLSSCS
jgi:hypothetical protein